MDLKIPKSRMLFNWSCYLITIVLFVLASIVLLSKDPVVTGIANNGDFWRVTKPVGLYQWAAPDRYKINPNYTKGTPQELEHYSSTSYLAEFSKVFSPIFGKQNQEYDIRQMGLSYLLLVGLSLILLAVWLPSWALLLWTWVSLDTRYLLYFNSFFSFPFLYVSIPLMAIVYLAAIKKISKTIAAFLLIIIIYFSTYATAQYLSLPYAFLLATVLFLFSIRKFWWRFALLISFQIALCFLTTPHLLSSTPLSYIYHFESIFSGPVLVSSAPEETMRRLEIPSTMYRFAKVPYFSNEVKGSPFQYDKRLFNTDKWMILREYLSSSETTFKTLERVGDEFRFFHSKGHGNYSEYLDAGDIPFVPWWNFFSVRTFINKVIPGSVFWIFFIVHGMLLCFCVFKAKSNPLFTFSFFLYTFVFSQFFITLLGSGFLGLGRHLLPASFTYDFCLLLTLVSLSKEQFFLKANRRSKDSEAHQEQ